MKKIYIEKLAEVPGGLPARSMEEHIDGQYQGDSHSLPVEYNLEGELSYDIEVGNNYFKTQNSVYSYKFL